MFNFYFIRFSISTILQMLCGLMLITLFVSLYYNDGLAFMYLRQILIMALGAFLLRYRITQDQLVRLRVPDLFLSTSITWVTIILVCMIPYILVKEFSFADALFEMTSGVTTSGASIILSLKDIPTSLLFWRSITQWMGGIGFVVVGVLILPNLNTGGMKLFKTESSDTEERAFTHYRQIAKYITLYYLILTFAAAFTYWYCGMNKLDAFMYSFTTVATGGFTPSDEPFNGLLDQYSAGVIFIYLSSLPFQVFILSFLNRKPMRIFKDRQIIVFTLIILVFGLLMTLDRYFNYRVNSNQNFWVMYKESIINIINIGSNTGYTISEFWNWGPVTYLLMTIAAILGGCSGSTAGGVKIFRLNILAAFTRHQINLTLHPNSNNQMTYQGQVIKEEALRSIFFFVMIFLLTAALILMSYCFSGLTISQAYSSTLTTLTNTGVSFGPNVSDSGLFATQTDLQKIIGSISMIFGRLEIITLLIVFIPRFWRY